MLTALLMAHALACANGEGQCLAQLTLQRTKQLARMTKWD
jgi:hypothetical protein